jgi:DNA-binding NarL/FixJ family response regulator
MNIKVAIADDHQLFIDGIKLILSNEIGITIISEAANGLELLKNLEKGPKPDIIITDMRMPVMDGIAATKVVSKEYPEIPILALTMFDQISDVFDMLKAGAKGYVTKEVKKDELVLAIHTLMKGKNYFSKNLPEEIKTWLQSDRNIEESALTRREREILNLLAKGRTTLQMAEELQISKFTIDTHRKNIHKKLGIKSNTGLVNYALKNLN